ncbi:MAG: exocyst complex component exo70 [Chaenotheca gracillima]|nr:MAG: exocyst complex component exo70 [Chaenotheca gracillima]
MWDFWKVAVLGIPLASALVIPDTWSAGRSHEDGHLIASTPQNLPSASFIFNISTPTDVEHDESQEEDNLTFKFDTLSSQGCIPDNITINDLALVPSKNADGPVFSGSFSGPSSRTESRKVDIVSGFWDLTCAPEVIPEHTNDAVVSSLLQSFALTIASINGKAVDQKSGFELTFNRSSVSRPVIDYVVDTLSRTEIRPSAEDPSSNPTDMRALLSDYTALVEQERKELQSLLEESTRIQKAIVAKQTFIAAHSDEDLDRPFTTNAQCNHISCIKQRIMSQLQNIVDSTRRTAKKICHKLHSGALFGHRSQLAFLQNSLSCHHNHTRGHNSSKNETADGSKNGATVPSVHNSLSHQDFDDSTDHLWVSTALLFLALTSTLLLPVLLFLFIRRRCSPARRLERRWLRETRRNVRAVRRAHRRHAWRVWWHNLWQARATIDYDEKRGRILSQEQRLEDAMQNEIRSLRDAAEIVTSLVTSEEGNGRSRTTASSSRAEPSPPQALPRRDSLPDYRSEAGYSEPPPTYESNDGTELSGVVVDGFQYIRNGTPTPTELWSPSTSVSTSVLSPSESSQDGHSDDDEPAKE